MCVSVIPGVDLNGDYAIIYVSIIFYAWSTASPNLSMSIIVSLMFDKCSTYGIINCLLVISHFGFKSQFNINKDSVIF